CSSLSSKSTSAYSRVEHTRALPAARFSPGWRPRCYNALARPPAPADEPPRAEGAYVACPEPNALSAVRSDDLRHGDGGPLLPALGRARAQQAVRPSPKAAAATCASAPGRRPASAITRLFSASLTPVVPRRRHQL